LIQIVVALPIYSFSRYNTKIETLLGLLRRRKCRNALGDILLRRNIAAVILGLITGTLLILSGSTNPIDYSSYILLAWNLLNLPPQFLPIALIANSILHWLGSFGGLTVIAGALLVAAKIQRIGRWFVGIGAGMSLLTLVWKLASEFMGLAPLGSALSVFTGAIGVAVVLAIITEELIVVEGKI